MIDELKNISFYVSEKIKVNSISYKDYISTENMIPNKGGVDVAEELPTASSVSMYQKDDVLVSNIRPYFRKIWFSNRTGGCSNDVIVFRVRDSEETYPKFLYYLLSQDSFFNYMMAGSNGTKMPRGNKKLILGYKFKNIGHNQQKIVADTLSAYDDLIENNQKQIKLLEEAAMRLYKEWFVDLRFPEHGNTAIVEGVPEGWEKKQLSEIADVVMGQSPKSEYYNGRRQGIPFHQGVTNYGERFVSNEIFTTSFTRSADMGSILFSVRAPVGRMNITKVKIAIGRGLSAINHKTNLQSLLFYMLKSRFYKDDLIGNGSIYASITKDELFEQCFLIPSEELSQNFNNIASKIDRDIVVIDAETILLIEARDKLLPKLMSGEIEV